MNAAALAELAAFAFRMNCTQGLFSEAKLAIQNNDTERAGEIVVLMKRQVATAYDVAGALEKVLEGKNG